MNHVAALTEFINPVTGTTYRLRPERTQHRITKVVARREASPMLRHMRLIHCDARAPSPADVDRLVRGEPQAPGAVAEADTGRAFAEVVLLDLDRTVTVVAACAAEARERCRSGMPGFRPGCATLRRREEDAWREVAGVCRALAAAWRASGLGQMPHLSPPPDWLAAALEETAAEPARPDGASRVPPGR